MLSLPVSLSLSGAVPRERNVVCEGGGLFGEAAGARGSSALPRPYLRPPADQVDRYDRQCGFAPPDEVQTRVVVTVERRQMRLAVAYWYCGILYTVMYYGD